MTPDLPPEPPAYVDPAELEGAPQLCKPRPVALWYEERDIYADLVLAWGLDQQTDAVLAVDRAELAEWQAERWEQTSIHLERRLRLRPTWPVVVGLVVVGSAASVYAWERVR